MKPDFQGFIQRIIVRTSFFPLTYFYRKVYDLSIAVAKSLLSRVDGVMSVYLRRGVAKNEIVYGLSDIDLLVIVDDTNRDEQTVESAKEKVISKYNKVSRLIPLLGEAGKELGVYSASEFFKLYAENGSWKYRFNEGKHTWKLLSGKDVVQALLPLEDRELLLAATEELKVWWPFLSADIAAKSTVPRFQRKYLWYKAISEACRVYLLVCHREMVYQREAALRKIKEYLTDEQKRRIETVQRYLKNLASRESLAEDDLMSLFIELSSKAFDEMERYGEQTRRKAILNTPTYRDLTKNSEVLNLMDRLEAYVSQKLKSCVDCIALVPQVDFPLDILHSVDIDSFDVVLVQRDFIPVGKLKEVKSLFEEHQSPQSVELFIMPGNIALSLTPKNWYQCIKSPAQCPLFFSLVSGGRPGLSGESGTQGKSVESDLPPSFEETIGKRIAAIDATISNRSIYRMKTLDFLRFFWAAARTKVIAHSLDGEAIYIPLTGKQICEMLIRFSPGDLDWLTDLYLEYNRELLAEESNAYRFFARAIDFLRRI